MSVDAPISPEEIEITPEMIEAARAVFEEWEADRLGVLDVPAGHGAVTDLVRRMYRAFLQSSSCSHEASSD